MKEDVEVDAIPTTKCSTTIQDKISFGMIDLLDQQPPPPGISDVNELPFLKAVESCPRPLIGLEFILELRIDDVKEPKYLCLLCNDLQHSCETIFPHLTNQSHYLAYLEQYFPVIFVAIKNLIKNKVNEDILKRMVSHLINKLEEKHGHLLHASLRESSVKIDALKEVILNSAHIKETPEDNPLRQIFSEKYIKNIDLLQVDFPLKSRVSLRNGATDKEICKEINDSIESSEKKNVAELETLSEKCSKSVDVNVIPLPLANGRSKIFKGTTPSVNKISSNCSSSKDIMDIIPMELETSSHCTTSSEKSFSSCAKESQRSGRKRSRSTSRHDRRHSKQKIKSPKRYGRRSRSRSRSAIRRRQISKSVSAVTFRHKSKSPSSKRNRSRSPENRRVTEYSRSFSSLRSRFHSKNAFESISSDTSESLSPKRVNSVKSFKSVICHTSESRSRSDSYKYHRAIRKISYKHSAISPRVRRSSSPSPKSTSSHSSSPARRLRRMLAHESLHEDTKCVVRIDTAKHVSNHAESDNIESDSHKTSHITSEVTVEVKSTINKEKSPSKMDEDEKLISYQKEFRRFKKGLRRSRREFLKNPESVPECSEEWKLFWCRRFKEIQDAGEEDPYEYNYEPDWLEYWRSRVKQIYKEKCEEQKLVLRKKWNIPDESTVVVKSEVIEISDEHDSLSSWEENAKKMLGQSHCSRLKNIDVESKKKNIPETNDKAATESSTSSAASCNSTQLASSNNSAETGAGKEKKSDSEEINLKNELNLISVLRQLTVLECQLGSFAAHVTSFLAGALAEEKKRPNSSMNLLTQENRLFLDVIKEKLKGQLALEVVPDAMSKATKLCIKSIDDLMKMFPETESVNSAASNISNQNNSIQMNLPPTISTSIPPEQFHNGIVVPNPAPLLNSIPPTISVPPPVPVPPPNPLQIPNSSAQVYAPPIHVEPLPYSNSQSPYHNLSEIYPSTYNLSSKVQSSHMRSSHLTNSNRKLHAQMPSAHQKYFSQRPKNVPSKSISSTRSSSKNSLSSSSSFSSIGEAVFATSTNPSFKKSVTSIHSSTEKCSTSSLKHSSSENQSSATPINSGVRTPLHLKSHLPINSAEVTKKPSIYDNIPWNKQKSSSVSSNSVPELSSLTSEKSVITSSELLSTNSTINPPPASVIDLTEEITQVNVVDKPVETLSEEELFKMLQNFRKQPRTKQRELVDFMRKLEVTSPLLVEKLQASLKFPPRD